MRAPLTLLAFQATWLFLVFAGFSLVFWGVAGIDWREAIRESGSALFTIGFATPEGGVPLFLVFAEAIIGLTLMALLISYLPTIYASFQQREFMVSKLAVRTGAPTSPWQALIIAQLTGSFETLDDAFWRDWEDWFIEIAESHTSLVILNFYRSPDPDNHWIATARTVLDMAALRIAVVDLPAGVGPHIAIRSGSLSFRTLARYFRFPHDLDPQPSDPISVTQDQFDVAYDLIAASGVPVVADRQAAWIAFAGWRVNYDAVIVAAADAFIVPADPWLSLGPDAIAPEPHDDLDDDTGGEIAP